MKVGNNIIDKKEKFRFSHYLILLCILMDLNFNFLYLYNYEKLMILGLFKPWDIVIVILLALFILNKKKQADNKYILLKKILFFFILFIVFYFIYTFLIAQTSSILEAFKASRNYLYIFLFFIYISFLSENIVYKFWLIYRYLLYISLALYLLNYIDIRIVNFGYPDFSGIIIRAMPYCPNTNIMLFMFGVLQIIIGYKGKFKLNKIEIVITVFFAIISLSRNYWSSFIVSIFIISFISFFKLSKRLLLKRQIKYAFTLAIIILIIMFTVSLGSIEETLIDRLIGGAEDIRYGKSSHGAATFTNRISTLESTMSHIEIYGLQYTGVGFVHITTSKWVLNIYNKLGFFGTEMAIGNNLIYFGYIGVFIWYLLWIILILKIFNLSRNAKDDVVFLFGSSLSIMIFAMTFISGWASSSTATVLNLSFLLAMFEKLYQDRELSYSK